MCIFKPLEQLTEIMFSNVSDGKPYPLFLVLNFGPKGQRGNQPLTWYSHIILWLWICDLPIVKTIEIRRDFHDDVLITIIYIPVFTNISPSTTCHVHRCEHLFPERLPNGATMINSWWWCYNCWELHVHIKTITV